MTIRRLEKQPGAREGLNDKVHLIHEAVPSRLGRHLLHLMHRNQPREKQNEETEACIPMKEQDTSLRGKSLSKMEINNLPNNEFKVMVIKMLPKLSFKRGGKY